uniref:Uncharacterized protein n=1 Tax=Tanacetum cinerariifolium TaxID=118510 RepID=A0A699GVA2_TANCI|nr:hypothetical protein [Tanacetum cinerariifolium]
MGLVAGKDDVDLLVRVDDLAVDLGVGVEELTSSVGLAVLTVEREVGVDDLVSLEGMFEVGLEVVLELVLVVELDIGLVAKLDIGLDDAANVGRPIIVVGLPARLAGLPLEETRLDPGPPEEEGLRSPLLVLFNLGDDIGCLDTMLFLPVAPGWIIVRNVVLNDGDGGMKGEGGGEGWESLW